MLPLRRDAYVAVVTIPSLGRPRWQLVVAALAVIAMKSLWSHGTDEPAETRLPRPQLSPPRKLSRDRANEI
jgi:hypothetical protein